MDNFKTMSNESCTSGRPGNAATLVDVCKEIQNLTDAATDAAKRAAGMLFADGCADKQNGRSPTCVMEALLGTRDDLQVLCEWMARINREVG